MQVLQSCEFSADSSWHSEYEQEDCALDFLTHMEDWGYVYMIIES